MFQESLLLRSRIEWCNNQILFTFLWSPLRQFSYRFLVNQQAWPPTLNFPPTHPSSVLSVGHRAVLFDGVDLLRTVLKKSANKNVDKRGAWQVTQQMGVVGVHRVVRVSRSFI